MIPKSLKLGLVSQVKFSNYLKPSQIFQLLTVQSNPCMQSIDMADPQYYSRRFFESMRPIAFKLNEEIPVKEWPENSQAAKQKLCVPVEMDVSEKTATEQVKNG